MQALLYSEKPVAVAEIYAEAMSRPQARRADGTWNQTHANSVWNSLSHLLTWDIQHIFTRFKLDQETMWLRRRKTVGNMTFSERNTCIGSEPEWHVKKREKSAKATREARLRRKQEAEEAAARGEVVLQPIKQKRTRKNPRRLARSLQNRPAKQAMLATAEPIHFNPS